MPNVNIEQSGSNLTFGSVVNLVQYIFHSMIYLCRLICCFITAKLQIYNKGES